MKPWLKTTFLILISFLVGVAATGVAFRLCFHPHHPPGSADADRILKHLDSKLAFTAEQKDKVGLLLKQELPKADALRQEGEQKFKALRESFRSQLRALLNADQVKKYDEMVAQSDQRMRKQEQFFGCAPVSMEPVTGR